MRIHKVTCPDCEERFYSNLPESFPKEKNELCPACDKELEMKYKESDEEGVVTDIEIGVKSNE